MGVRRKFVPCRALAEQRMNSMFSPDPPAITGIPVDRWAKQFSERISKVALEHWTQPVSVTSRNISAIRASKRLRHLKGKKKQTPLEKEELEHLEWMFGKGDAEAAKKAREFKRNLYQEITSPSFKDLRLKTKRLAERRLHAAFSVSPPERTGIPLQRWLRLLDPFIAQAIGVGFESEESLETIKKLHIQIAKHWFDIDVLVRADSKGAKKPVAIKPDLKRIHKRLVTLTKKKKRTSIERKERNHLLWVFGFHNE